MVCVSAVPEDPDADVDEDTQSLLTSDFEIGHYIRERIVPRAILYFTGKFKAFATLYVRMFVNSQLSVITQRKRIVEVKDWPIYHFRLSIVGKM